MKYKRLTISAIILLLAAISCTKTINTPLPHEITVPSGIDAVAEEFLNFYEDEDLLGKIKAGPVWDFDWETFTPISSLKSYEITGIYYSRLMQDPEFKATVKEHWNAMKPQLQAIPDKIESLSKQIEASEAVNWSMWPITKDWSWNWRNINGDIKMTFPEAVSRMKNAYTAKLNWMDNLISSF